MENEYVAILKVVEQIGPDDFEIKTKCLKITNETTVGEINKWFKSHVPTGNLDYSIIKLETVPLLLR